MEVRETDIDEIIHLEKRALERWCRGDPSGFLEISASDVVYFDPFLDRRLDGLSALTAYYESLRGKISASRFEVLRPGSSSLAAPPWSPSASCRTAAAR